MFRSVDFPIENRPGLEDASIEKAMSQLAKLGAPDVHDSRQGGRNSDQRKALAKWLSDWHLIAFLDTSGLFSQEDLHVLLRTATSSDLEDPIVLDKLIGTGSWQTLMTFTRETHRQCPPSTPTPCLTFHLSQHHNGQGTPPVLWTKTFQPSCWKSSHANKPPLAVRRLQVEAEVAGFGSARTALSRTRIEAPTVRSVVYR
jgi:hypothetical protein